MSPLELIAQALHELDEYPPDCPPWDLLDVVEREEYRRDAQHLLDALAHDGYDVIRRGLDLAAEDWIPV